ncbi:hypothetical protein BC941DRAFT_425887 [Chlamydoabsidia padenii]|nr:hypothetical protein BC941DRAFT_425887 [Chlamydoabsidia padenii]
MNRLSFGSFHAAHFSPQHTQQWQSYLQQLHSHTYEHYYPPQEPGHYTHEELRRTDQDLDNNSGDDDDDDLPLSKEAIEIFEFSEAFSKERRYHKMTWVGFTNLFFIFIFTNLT